MTVFETLPETAALSDLDVCFVGREGLSDELADKLGRSGAKCVLVQSPGLEAPGTFGGAILSWPLSRSEFEALVTAMAEDRFASSIVRPVATNIVANHSGFTALVADDNEVNREVAREALSLLGFTTTLVCDGREAVEAVGKTPFDIIFLDGSMPVLDGFGACRQIRISGAQSERRRVPIVALTAHVLGTEVDAWEDAGADAKLAKPFTLDALQRCVTALLEGSGPRTNEALKPEAAPEVPSSVLDTRTIDELKRFATAGRADFVNRVVQLYREHAPNSVADIEGFGRAGDLVGLAKAAHALKSMSLNIGAHRVAACAGDIEQAAKSGQSVDAATLALLNERVGAACAELAGLLTSTAVAA